MLKILTLWFSIFRRLVGTNRKFHTKALIFGDLVILRLEKNVELRTERNFTTSRKHHMRKIWHKCHQQRISVNLSNLGPEMAVFPSDYNVKIRNFQSTTKENFKLSLLPDITCVSTSWKFH